MEKAKKSHNAAALRLLDKLRGVGREGFIPGYPGCPLCDPCKRTENQPWVFPEKRSICMSAYCIDVEELAKRCDLEYAWTQGTRFIFGMIAFHEK